MNKLKYNKNSPEAIIRLLYAMAYADKFISDEEIKIITKIEKNYSVSKDTSANIIEDIKNNDISEIFKSSIQLIEKEELRKKSLSWLGELATSDHILHENELYFLQIVAERWGMFVPSLKSLNE
jgi:uncharacterized tellurite resistance protein B-like protein